MVEGAQMQVSQVRSSERDAVYLSTALTAGLLWGMQLRCWMMGPFDVLTSSVGVLVPPHPHHQPLYQKHGHIVKVFLSHGKIFRNFVWIFVSRWESVITAGQSVCS